MSRINHVAAFFASYPTFRYNPDAPSPGWEFRRLCELMAWERDDPEQKAAWEEFQNAVAKMFNQTYGEDAESLEAWQKLCITLRPEAKVPKSLEKARETVFNTHVNLMDLAMAQFGPKVELWPTEAALAEYTKRTQKIVSSSSPQAGGLLKALLRHIISPPEKDLKRDQFGKYVRGRGGFRGSGRARRR